MGSLGVPISTVIMTVKTITLTAPTITLLQGIIIIIIPAPPLPHRVILNLLIVPRVHELKMVKCLQTAVVPNLSLIPLIERNMWLVLLIGRKAVEGDALTSISTSSRKAE